LSRPNSTTGQSFDRKRASEVPPVVDSSGRRPCRASIASPIRVEKAPGAVRKASPEMRAMTWAAGAWRVTISSIRVTRSAPRCRSLKRIDSRAEACAGMTLVAGLPTVMSVASIF